MKFQTSAVGAAQEAAEAYIVESFSDTQDIASHAKRVGISQEDSTSIPVCIRVPATHLGSHEAYTHATSLSLRGSDFCGCRGERPTHKAFASHLFAYRDQARIRPRLSAVVAGEEGAKLIAVWEKARA
ncbi:hypothetical protein CONLIGDRAFT_679718 [Coniochaeta ligniaria NRRL 30616]|uniref:Core Histone H2A/H2B/H3 domain-containing protein n=1 Tax=Coniochaeta ligniaria NRRL 30616 TaxID=1408157 RepID=A0A1J7ITF6_9PEZI|nr:hypothetical protein CONLIGDRAFT_679718 [Coniochaeta ligniaria NRRL 30616]